MTYQKVMLHAYTSDSLGHIWIVFVWVRLKIDELYPAIDIDKKIKVLVIRNLFIFLKRPMATKHCKYQYKTMIFALPRDAPRFTKNVKKRSKNNPKSSKNCGRRPPKHASEKRPQKKSTKIAKKSNPIIQASPKISISR